MSRLMSVSVIVLACAVCLAGCKKDDQPQRTPPPEKPAARPTAKPPTPASHSVPSAKPPATRSAVRSQPASQPAPSSFARWLRALTDPSTKRRSPSNIKAMYKCEACSKEFEVDYSKQSPEERLGMMEMGPGMMKMPNCPLCGAKESGLPMVRCPKTDCLKYYVGESAEFHKRMAAGDFDPGMEQPRDICPHCGTDRMKWYKEHRKRRRRRKPGDLTHSVQPSP